MDATRDCIIVGGGAAGLAAAITLGRARRSVLLVDAGAQSNLSAHAIGGLLGGDRRPPSELYARGRVELREYPSVTVRDATIDALAGDGDRFTATLGDGTVLTARRVVLATGMDYRYPELPGADERWGTTAFHCPFCHGWEVAGRPLAVISEGAVGVHQALLLRAWSDDVTLVSGPGPISEEDRDRLQRAGVALRTAAPRAIHGSGSAIDSVTLSDGGELRCDAVLLATQLRQRTALAAELGVALADPNPLCADAIVVDEMQATSLPGVYAAGDVLGRPPAVASAIASGHLAGAMVVASLFV